MFGPTLVVAGVEVSPAGRPHLPIRLMVSLLYLKYAFNQSDESVVERWSENVVWQLFSSMEYYIPKLPCVGTQISRFRKILGEAGVVQLLKTTHGEGLMVGARTCPGNPYNRHTLAALIEQTTTLLEKIGAKPTTAVVDLGYRGADDDVPTVNVSHRGKVKSLTARQKSWLMRRQAVELAIGHLNADHRMDRCWLKGSEGDALHVVLCAAGFNIRWLMCAIAGQAAKTAETFLFVLFQLWSWTLMTLGERYAAIKRAESHPDQTTRRAGTTAPAYHQFALREAG